MNLRPVDTSPAPTEPITLEEARLHLRVTATGSPPTHPDDDLITTLITVAREMAEKYTGRGLASASYELRVHDFGDRDKGGIRLPLAPVTEVSAVKYIDSDGTEQTLATDDYVFLDDPNAPSVRLAPDADAPDLTDEPDAVRITFTAGYAVDDVPKPIYQAMLLMIGHLYENREDSAPVAVNAIPMGSISLMTPYRLGMGM
jgi:uncharacterized phiE125 gp8 family phage protein